jgi:hypothetical protein
VAAAGALVVGGAAMLGGGGEDPPAAATGAAGHGKLELAPCRALGSDAARQCYADAFAAVVRGRDDPRPGVAAIAAAAWKEGPGLVADCHGIMHTVGRAYARDQGVDVGTLMAHLPQANDPGCTAGFAHGMVTAVAGDVDPERPGDAARVCEQAGTRYQRYSCVHGFGHAFMRLYGDQLEPALALCTKLGERVAADCAQGAYHDYWFAVIGADDAEPPDDVVRDPRALCAAAPAAYVRPCWYRAWLENRPAAFEVQAPEDLDALCAELTGAQRDACITAASVIGPADPAEQLALCARMPAARDAASCARGVKVQNLGEASVADFVALADRCDRFPPAAREPCFAWLGTALAVVTDGAFTREGCPALQRRPGRRACARGAAASDRALQTFS